MANNLEDEVLESFNIGEEVILESIDTNSALDSRIIEKMKVGDRVNSDLRYHRRNVPRSKRSYRRNDLPRTYLLADALLSEVRDYIQQRDIGYTDSLQAENWDVSSNEYIGGRALSNKDKGILGKLTKDSFLSLRYGEDVYLVSRRLLDNDDISDDFIKIHGLDEVVSKLGNHLGLEIVMQKENLPDSQAEVIVVYGKQQERQSIFPQADRDHTSLLMENTYESAGNGYGSRVSDDLIKGGDEFLERLPSPGQTLFEMHGKSKGIRGFHIDNPAADEIAKSQKKQNP